MACELPGNFIPASYKGVGFYVESATKTGGRRIATHEYPNSEEWYCEDLGIKTPKFSGTAYFASGDGDLSGVYSDSDGLYEACNEEGPGLLVLPPDIFVTAHCETVTRKFEKDKQGWIAFDLEFIGDDVGFGGGPIEIGFGLAARLISGGLAGVVSVLAGAAFGFFAAVVPLFEVRIAVGSVLRVAAAIIDTADRASVVVDDLADLTPPLFRAMITAIDNFEAAEAESAPQAYADAVTAFANYAISVVDTTQTPRAIAESLQTNVLILTQPTAPVGEAIYVGRTEPTTYSTEYAQAVAQATGLAGVVSAMVMAQAYADVPYTTRREAQLARGKLVATINLVLETLGDAPGIDYLENARNQCAKAIADNIATLNPIQKLQFPQSLTALYISWRLYRDPLKSEALADLNGAPHPSFMPAMLEAEAADARSLNPPRQR